MARFFHARLLLSGRDERSEEAVAVAVAAARASRAREWGVLRERRGSGGRAGGTELNAVPFWTENLSVWRAARSRRERRG